MTDLSTERDAPPLHRLVERGDRLARIDDFVLRRSRLERVQDRLFLPAQPGGEHDDRWGAPDESAGLAVVIPATPVTYDERRTIGPPSIGMR